MKYGVIRLSSPIKFIASVKLVNEWWSKYSWNVFLELTRSGSKNHMHAVHLWIQFLKDLKDMYLYMYFN